MLVIHFIYQTYRGLNKDGKQVHFYGMKKQYCKGSDSSEYKTTTTI